MNNILKLVNLDKALLKPYIKYYVIIFVVPLIYAYDMKNITSSFIFFMCMMVMSSNYTFSIAEKNDLNRLYGVIPVSKKEIVAGRYASIAIFGIIAAAISMALNMMIMSMLNIRILLEDILVAVSFGLLIYFFFTALQIPGYFKFGAIKGRFLTFLPLLGFVFVGVIFRGASFSNASFISNIALLNNEYALLAFSILMDIVFYCISMGISYKIYENMEL